MLVIEGAPEEQAEEMTLEQAVAFAREQMARGLPLRKRPKKRRRRLPSKRGAVPTADGGKRGIKSVTRDLNFLVTDSFKVELLFQKLYDLRKYSNLAHSPQLPDSPTYPNYHDRLVQTTPNMGPENRIQLTKQTHPACENVLF